MPTEFKLPPLGENIVDADVVNVLVKVGDTIQKDQPVLEAETEKAAFEVPSTVAGTVRELRVKAGDRIKVGQVILIVEEGEAKAAAGGQESPTESDQPSAEASEKKGDAKKEAPKKTASPEAKEKEAPAEEKSAKPVGQKEKKDEAKTKPAPEKAPPPPSSPPEIYASPMVRRMARELELDLTQVKGTGPNGRLTAEDIKTYVGAGHGGRSGPESSHGPVLILPDFSKWGPVERKPMTNVRRKTAEHVGRSWNAIPHVTQFDEADITELEQLRKRFAKRVEEAGGHLSMTAIVLKVAAAALKVFPQMNASVDLEKEEIVYKNYFHIGIAVDTDRGLIVPVIRDVDKKNILELSVELKQVAEKARAKKTTLDEMQGASFTITNLGNIGGGHFTPIINWPEVAILGIGRSSVTPVWIDGKFEPKTLLPLSLSYDHRLIDGADGARFLRWVAEAVTEPFLMDLEG